MDFWSLAYEQNWIGDTEEEKNVTLLRVVKTKENPFGEISPEEYKVITGLDFLSKMKEEQDKKAKKTVKKSTKKSTTKDATTEDKKEVEESK